MIDAEDRKVIMQIFSEGFEQIVLPYFARIQEEIAGIHIELSEIKQDVAVLKEDVTILKQDVAVLKQDVVEIKQILQDHSFRLDRVETKLDEVIAVQNRHDVEIKQLKDKLA